MDSIAKETVRLTCSKGRLPEVCSIVVLQLTKRSQSLVISNKGCTLAVWTLQGVHQIDNIISRDICRRSGSVVLTAICGVKNAHRLALAISIQESILFSIGQSLAELVNDIALKIESSIIEKLLGYLDSHMELVGIHHNLVKGSVTKGQCTALLNPCRSRLGSCNVNLVLSRGGYLCCKAAHDVLLVEYINKPVIIFYRHQIAALLIIALLQHIADIAETGTHGSQHILLVFIGCPKASRRLCIFRLIRNRLTGRLIKLSVNSSLTLQAINSLFHFHNISFHLFIGSSILSRKLAILISVGIQKILCFFPQLYTLISKFHNLIHFTFLQLIPNAYEIQMPQPGYQVLSSELLTYPAVNLSLPLLKKSYPHL